MVIGKPATLRCRTGSLHKVGPLWRSAAPPTDCPLSAVSLNSQQLTDIRLSIWPPVRARRLRQPFPTRACVGEPTTNSSPTSLSAKQPERGSTRLGISGTVPSCQKSTQSLELRSLRKSLDGSSVAGLLRDTETWLWRSMIADALCLTAMVVTAQRSWPRYERQESASTSSACQSISEPLPAKSWGRSACRLRMTPTRSSSSRQ
mgnify:FL=1